MLKIYLRFLKIIVDRVIDIKFRVNMWQWYRHLKSSMGIQRSSRILITARYRESGDLVRESESVDIFVGSSDDRVDDPFIKT